MTAHPFAELVRRILREADDDRPRSQQAAAGVLGFSDASGAECAASRRLAGAAQPNASNVSRLPAYIGTAVHEALARDVGAALPFAEPERRVTLPLPGGPLPGSADLVEHDTDVTTVTDWKTSTRDALAGADDDGRWSWPRRSQKEQVNGYAAALIAEGATRPRVRVRLVGIPREGNEAAVRVWEADYDPNLAQSLAERAERVRATVDRGDLADPGRPAGSWCSRFCPFYAPDGDGTADAGCPGLPDKAVDSGRELDDDETRLALDYAAERDLEKAAKARKDALRLALEGSVGVRQLDDGRLVTVGFSQARTKPEPDLEAAGQLLAAYGLDLPLTPGGQPKGDPRITVNVKEPKP